MANKYAASNGNFHSTGASSIWYNASASNVAGYSIVEPPTIDDVAIANGKIIDITQDVNCLALHNGSGRFGGSATPGGRFKIDTSTNVINITASQIIGTALVNNSIMVSAVGSNALNIYGNIYAPESGATATFVGYTFWNEIESPVTIRGDISGPNFNGYTTGNTTYGNVFALYDNTKTTQASTTVYGTIYSARTRGSHDNSRSRQITTAATSKSTINVHGSIRFDLMTPRSSDSRGLNITGQNIVTVNGDIIGSAATDSTSSAARPIDIETTSGPVSLTVNGNIYAYNCPNAILFQTTVTSQVTATVNGNLISGIRGYPINYSGTNKGKITVNGNIVTRPSVGVSNVNAEVYINGNVVTTDIEPAVYSASTSTGIIFVNGNLIGSPQGVPAIQAPFVVFSSNVYQPYITHAKSSLVVSPTTFDMQNYYTTDSSVQMSVPPISSVRSGVQYGYYTGSCEIPAPEKVYYGVRYDHNGMLVGTATVNPLDFYLYSPTELLNQANTIGKKLASTATTEILGQTIASLE